MLPMLETVVLYFLLAVGIWVNLRDFFSRTPRSTLDEIRAAFKRENIGVVFALPLFIIVAIAVAPGLLHLASSNGAVTGIVVATLLTLTRALANYRQSRLERVVRAHARRDGEHLLLDIINDTTRVAFGVRLEVRAGKDALSHINEHVKHVILTGIAAVEPGTTTLDLVCSVHDIDPATTPLLEVDVLWYEHPQSVIRRTSDSPDRYTCDISLSLPALYYDEKSADAPTPMPLPSASTLHIVDITPHDDQLVSPDGSVGSC